LNRIPSHRVTESADYPSSRGLGSSHAPQLSISSDYLSPQRHNEERYSLTPSLDSSPSSYTYKNHRAAYIDGSSATSDFYISPSMLSIYRGDSTGSYSNGLNAQGQPVRSQAPYPYPVQRMPEPEPAAISDLYAYEDAGPSNGPASVVRRPSDMLRDIANYRHSDDDYGDLDGLDEEGEWRMSEREPRGDLGWGWEYDDEEENFVNFSLLSHLAVQLKDKVPRGTHVKGSIPYPRAFTGKDIVVSVYCC